MTEEQADSLIRRWLDTDITAGQLRQKYVPILRKVLPEEKAATFFQLERGISMMIDVQLTSQLPLMPGQEQIVCFVPLHRLRKRDPPSLGGPSHCLLPPA